MPGPHHSRTIFSTIAFAALFILIAATYALFHGYFDRGHFEVKQAEWSSARQVALVTKRSDNDALNGDEIFVVIENHLLSLSELRRALHSDAVIFGTDRDCLKIEWRDSTHLLVRCDGGSITQDQIDVQKQKKDGIIISYANIATKTATN
ncbi:hypothetical protein [Tunturiibacter gelidiferens]|uniref:hypothetical protein n=1 Tax=Tunturiibacter gelidiferens TaxID=3069689 RepID=UPI003D9AB859